jgi:hypothetical protein
MALGTSLVLAAVSALLGLLIAVRAGAQEEAVACPDPQLIDQFTGTADQQTDTFRTDTYAFRLTSDLRAISETEPGTMGPRMNVFVHDEQEATVDVVAQGEGTEEKLVNAPPADYKLDISLVGDAQYTVTIEQCEVGPPSTTSESAASEITPTIRPTPSPPSVLLSPPPAPLPPPQPAPPFKAGGPKDGPVPLMPNGICPKEFPVKQGEACYRP